MKKCKECGGELKPKIDFFNQDNPNGFKELQKDIKKEFKVDASKLPGYNCIECGACYDENFKRENINMAWLKK